MRGQAAVDLASEATSFFFFGFLTPSETNFSLGSFCCIDIVMQMTIENKRDDGPEVDGNANQVFSACASGCCGVKYANQEFGAHRFLTQCCRYKSSKQQTEGIDPTQWRKRPLRLPKASMRHMDFPSGSWHYACCTLVLSVHIP